MDLKNSLYVMTPYSFHIDKGSKEKLLQGKFQRITLEVTNYLPIFTLLLLILS